MLFTQERDGHTVNKESESNDDAITRSGNIMLDRIVIFCTVGVLDVT